jgi:hypothetical protein
MDGRIRIKLKNFTKISKIKGNMSPPIPLVMRIVILLIGGWNFFLFHWAQEFSS